MKMKIFGMFLMLVGCVGIIVGSGAIANAAEPPKENGAAVSEQKSAELKTGKYVCGEKCITIYDDETFEADFAPRQQYKLKIWYDMPETDEVTGAITLKDYYFLGTNLDGGKSFSEKIAFDYEHDALVYGGLSYIFE